MAQSGKDNSPPKHSDTVQKIIEAAELRMRAGGMHGFSFREIAADVGVKSASVHHHFPTKEDLAVAVVRNYTDREIDALGDADDPASKPEKLLASYIGLFRAALVDEERMCLCGLLASESSSLPDKVRMEVQRFFERNASWTERVIARLNPSLRKAEVKSKALMLTVALEGALLGSHCFGDVAMFDKVAKQLKTSLLPDRTS